MANGVALMALEEAQGHERAGAKLEAVPPVEGQGDRYFDSVGRPRKLAAGAMKAIQREFEKGISSTELAERYGCSTNLILTICYFTPKGSPLRRPEMPDLKPVGWGEKPQ
jgi:Mor family transcriptional regulator